MSERDTHFRSAARLLVEQMDGLPEEERETLIAQFAYDIVRHAIDCVAAGYYASAYLRVGEDMEDVPDLTAWPEHSE